jgi:CRP-like cAMP-binding protein
MLDRTHIGLSQEEERLYSALKLLTPGEFRSLVKIARWSVASTDQIITVESTPLHRLYYVLDGAITVEKGGRTFEIPADTFIGEVAFLRNTPASATVTLGTGARYIVWSSPELERTLQSRSALRNAFIRMIGMDTAEKVARA